MGYDYDLSEGPLLCEEELHAPDELQVRVLPPALLHVLQHSHILLRRQADRDRRDEVPGALRRRLLLLRPDRDRLLGVPDGIAPGLLRERPGRADDGDPGGDAGDSHRRLGDHHPIDPLELHLRLLPGPPLPPDRGPSRREPCGRQRPWGADHPRPHHSVLFQHRDPLRQLHHDLQEGRPHQHALHEHLGALRGGLLPHHRPAGVASDGLSPFADDLLAERDEARSPPGLQLAGAGAGRGDPGPLLSVALTGEPSRLSVCGPEGEDGGDAGALLRGEEKIYWGGVASGWRT